MKKFMLSLGIFLIFVLVFLCIEYFLYRLLIDNENIRYILSPLFVLLYLLLSHLLDRLKIFNRHLNDFVILGAGLLSSFLLKFFI